ncbi:MAG: RNA polymerase sigma factor [Terriglobales bacterium]
MSSRDESSERKQQVLAEIITRARAGQSAAWGEMYEEYAPALYRFCRHTLRNHEDAEDATAEIFLKLRQKLDQYDAERPFSPWLYRLAANHCYDLLRRRSRQGPAVDDFDTLPAKETDPNQLDRLVLEQRSDRVRQGLEGLGERARMALMLRYYCELSYDDIAEALQVPRAYVGVVVLRARQPLREELEKWSGA